MKGRLSPSRVDILRMLVAYEPAVLARIKILNGKFVEKPKSFDVLNDGQVVLYHGSGPKWWQRFFGTYEQVSIIDIALKLADLMSGSGEARNEEAFYGIMNAILKEATDNNDLDTIVDILFDSVRSSSNGELHSKYINEKYLQRYAKNKELNREKLGIVDLGLNAYIGIRTAQGRILPCAVGRVEYHDV